VHSFGPRVRFKATTNLIRNSPARVRGRPRIANLLYRFTAGGLILEGWHRARWIHPSVSRRARIKGIYFCTARHIRAAAAFLFLYTRARTCALANLSSTSHSSFSQSAPVACACVRTRFLSRFCFPRKRDPASETNPTNSNAIAPHPKKELVIESAITAGSFFYLPFPSDSRVHTCASHTYATSLCHMRVHRR